MKVFLVFIGILFISLSFLAYNADVAQYEKMQVFLKAEAEDCAAGAALYYDEGKYSGGEWSIKEKEAQKFIARQLEMVERSLNKTHNGILTYEASFASTEVIVTLHYCCEDLFRLPFLFLDTVTRSAKYEWKN